MVPFTGKKGGAELLVVVVVAVGMGADGLSWWTNKSFYTILELIS